jgi:hypothetical protein
LVESISKFEIARGKELDAENSTMAEGIIDASLEYERLLALRVPVHKLLTTSKFCYKKHHEQELFRRIDFTFMLSFAAIKKIAEILS